MTGRHGQANAATALVTALPNEAPIVLLAGHAALHVLGMRSEDQRDREATYYLEIVTLFSVNVRRRSSMSRIFRSPFRTAT